jgi:hypothetical protein
VTAFKEVSIAGISSQRDGRSVVPLPDDTRIGGTATTIVQNIARLFLSRARAADVDPAGVSGAADLGFGLVEHTGGADFVRFNNFTRAVDSIWAEAGHYDCLL